jgi:hypothetical protein
MVHDVMMVAMDRSWGIVGGTVVGRWRRVIDRISIWVIGVSIKAPKPKPERAAKAAMKPVVKSSMEPRVKSTMRSAHHHAAMTHSAHVLRHGGSSRDREDGGPQKRPS